MLEYSSEYAEQLAEGMRLDGKTDVECCLQWGILYSQYKKWIKEIPEFAQAAELGDMQCAAYWHNEAKNLAKKGNASVLIAGMKNLSVANWVDKKDPDFVEAAPVRAIEITILPPREEQEDDNG